MRLIHCPAVERSFRERDKQFLETPFYGVRRLSGHCFPALLLKRPADEWHCAMKTICERERIRRLKLRMMASCRSIRNLNIPRPSRIMLRNKPCRATITSFVERRAVSEYECV